ncbi:MAG: ferrous iron transport protein A [Phycisphaerales bacterium JB040]
MVQTFPQNSPPAAPPPQRRTSLAHLRRGETAVIESASLHRDDEAMLAAMGLRAETRVRICRSGQPCIVRVMGGCGLGCRIGLSRPVASGITVRLDDDGTAKA